MKSIIHVACILMLITVTVACQHQQVARTSSVLSFDDTVIAYDVAGRGEPALVFVHCWTCDRTFWDAQFEHFAREYTVVRLDLAGHGASGKSRQHHTLSGFSDDVVAVVRELKLPKMLLIGHSMGGPVSVEAAARLGDRVVGVVGVDSFYTAFPIPRTDEEAAAFVKPFENDFAGTNSRFLETMFLPGADPVEKEAITAIFMRADKTMAIQALNDVVRWYRFDADGRLASLGGRLRNINAASPANKAPPREGVTLISGVGHFIPQMKPVAFNQALEQIITLVE
jgi:pimeloyl-ACP methyl ester carboxylesterase